MPSGFNANNHSGFVLDPLIDSEDEVLQIRACALQFYKAGKSIMEWSGEGTSARKEFVAPVSEVLMETRRCLKLMNPDVYGSVVRQSQMIRTG